MCVRPTKRRNPKYRMNKKNGGIIPPLNDRRQLVIDTPCGQCYICRKKKSREWSMRLREDFKENKKGKVVLLTFNTESLRELAKKCKGLTGYEKDNQICRIAVKLFRERWRKKYGRSIRHWLITELGHGETEHIHMHGIVWEEHYTDLINKESGEVTRKLIKHDVKGNFLDEVERVWNYGFVGKGKKDWQTGKRINYVDNRTANYFVKYVNKIDEAHKEYRQIILTSAGIGKAFLNSERALTNIYRGENTIQGYQVPEGGVIAMPEYFRRKIYNDEQREKLAGWGLDTNITYIDGTATRTDLNDSQKSQIYRDLQEKNARLGYGDGRKNYERKMHENSKRREIHRKRGI